MEYYSIDDIKRINENKGKFFFSPVAMRVFKSRVGNSVYQGTGGVYFITSEQFDRISPRQYTVRQFDPKTGSIHTAGEFNRLSRYTAHAAAKLLAKGE